MASIETTAPAKRESTIKDFLEVVFRRKWIIGGIVVVAVALTVILTLRQPALYESSAKMLVRRGETPGAYDASVRTLTWEEDISSQIELIKSQIVVDEAQKILPRYLPAGDSASKSILLGAVNAGVIATSNVIWVTYNTGDPVFCKAAVNAVVNAYKEYYTGIRTPPVMEDFFSREIARIQEELEFWRARKESVLQEGNIIDIETQRSNLIQRLALYENNLDEVVLDRRDKELVIANLKRLGSSSIEEVAAASSGLTTSSIELSVVSDLRVKIQNLKLQESELAARFTEQNPDLVRIRRQIEDAQAMLSREIDTQIAINSVQLDLLVQREGILRGIVRDLAAQKAGYPQKEVELDRITTTIAKLENMHEDVANQHMAAKIKLASNPEWTITILNPASDAYRKTTRDYVRMALGPFFSLIIALGLAFFIDNLDHSIKSIAEAEENLGLSVLANFPETSGD